MLFDILTYGGTAVFFLVVGAGIGAHNVPTVDKAITALKGAEASAQAQLQKITAHKAS